MVECVFCGIVEGSVPSEKVAENDGAVAFLTIGPLRTGHALVVPRRHARDLSDARPEDLAAVARLAQTVARLQRDRLGSAGETLFLASGKEAEQSVFHLHLHVVPRHGDDALDLNGWWEARVQHPSGEDLRRVGDRLHALDA